MAQAPVPESSKPGPPDIDENGVDRAQIREMLRLPPEERLRRVEAFVEAALEIRATLDERDRR